MDTYTITKAQHWTADKEIRIESPGLFYVEICNGSGAQCRSVENSDKIREYCNQVADLIRKIDELNKVE